MSEEADCIEQAVEKTLEQGYRTGDIMQAGAKAVGCVAMSEAVLANI
jgi:3-isopropylmalate dehydrogenase